MRSVARVNLAFGTIFISSEFRSLPDSTCLQHENCNLMDCRSVFLIQAAFRLFPEAEITQILNVLVYGFCQMP